MASSQERTTPSKLSKDSKAFPSFTGKAADLVWDPLITDYTHGTSPLTFTGPGGVKIAAYF